MFYSAGLFLSFSLIYWSFTSIRATTNKGSFTTVGRDVATQTKKSGQQLMPPWLPSTLTDPPVKSIVPPGQCQFSKKFISVPLLKKIKITSTSYVLRFGLPDIHKSLGLSTCACLLAGIKMEGDDDMIIRPYTPISTNAMVGTFDLLVKVYPDGKMSSYITSLEPSPSQMAVSFMHIAPNVKIQYPFGKPKFIGMIAGGTGITPMIQAVHALLGEGSESDVDNDHHSTKVSLLYGSKTFDDILGKEMLDSWLRHSNKVGTDKQFTVTHVLSKENVTTSQVEEGLHNVMYGHIGRELIEKSFPSPSFGKDVKIFVCGPPSMYDALCGAREKKEVTGILGEMGYTSDQVYKF